MESKLLALTVLLAFATADLTPKKQKFLATIAYKCSEEIGYELESGRELLLGDLSDSSEKAMCFTRCFFKKGGFLNESDEPQREFAVDFLAGSLRITRDQLAEVIKRCTKPDGDEPCSAAYKILDCYINDKTIIKAS